MVKVEQRIRYCGMYSHNSDVEKGEKNFLVSMDHESCETLVKFAQMKYRDILIVDLAANMTNRRSLTTAGQLTSNGKCSGTTYINKNECYHELPANCEGKIGFLKPSSRILVALTTPIDCNCFQPPYFDIQGDWHQFLPKPTRVNTPPTLTPHQNPTWRYEEIKNIIDHGIHREDELESCRNISCSIHKDQR